MISQKSLKAAVLVFVCIQGIVCGGTTVLFQQGETKDQRSDRMVALQVPVGEPATPFLEAGKFSAKFEGKLKLKERRRLYFSFEGSGSVALTINGVEELVEAGKLGTEKTKRLRLNPGEHDFVVSYGSNADGSAELRFYWEEAELPRQTIPPTAYAPIVANEELTKANTKRMGRFAFTQQNCAKCHVEAKGFGSNPMPEMGEIAPILAGIGDRVSEEWLRNWIADPAMMKHSTTMPRLVDPQTKEGLQDAADLAAFLAASKMAVASTPKPMSDEEIRLSSQRGGIHFHELGCIACHQLDTEKDDELNRVSLAGVGKKFLPGQLAAYLKKPDAFHPFTAMPDFLLSEIESKELADFLIQETLQSAKASTFEFPPGDAARGAQVAESLQCGVCHPGSPGGLSRAVSLESIFEKDWEKEGCLAPEDHRNDLPKLNLQVGERDSLLAFQHEGSASLKKKSSAEFAARQLSAKNCVACHMQDDVPSIWDSLRSSTSRYVEHLPTLEERVDQSRPQLTFVGEMLFTDYIQKMLAGTVKDQPRPWLASRMPAFRAYASPLAEGLSRIHGFEPSSGTEVDLNQELVDIGESLIGSAGFGCTTCHGVGPLEATAAFEVAAINFSKTADRLREDYYFRWMDHPGAVTPGSKMPKYADGNKSLRGDILGGDAALQYEAIWQWLHSLK